MIDKKRRVLFFVSLIGIVVVSLMLVTTYAYQTIVVDYTEGSSNKLNKENIKTAKLDVCLIDRTDKEECNNGEEIININVSNMPLLPDYKTANYTEFIITNNSTKSIAYSISLTDLTYSNVMKNSSFRYTITRITEKNETVVGSGDFSNLTGTTFDLTFNIGKYSDIIKDGTNKLRLYLWLHETNEDQSDLESTADNKVSFKGKLEITSLFSDEVSSPSTLLAENIINNARQSKVNNSETLTKFMEPLTKVAEEKSSENERVLYITEDDLGTSYYYRGNVEDNYVNFAGMCWRIVRIEGDGSTKLILEDQYTTCDDLEDTDGEGTTDYAYTGNWNIGKGNYGYELKNVDSDSSNEYIMNYLMPVDEKDKSMVKAFYDFQINELKNYTSLLKAGDWCLGDKAYTRNEELPPYIYTPLEKYDYSGFMYYDSYVRLIGDNLEGLKPTYKCNGTILNEFESVEGVSSKLPMYVSAITADEVTYAGGNQSSNQNYYLINEAVKNEIFSFLHFWLLSPYLLDVAEDFAFYVNYEGIITGEHVFDSYVMSFRPSVSLNSNITVTTNSDIENYGDPGTITNPYIVQ